MKLRRRQRRDETSRISRYTETHRAAVTRDVLEVIERGAYVQL